MLSASCWLGVWCNNPNLANQYGNILSAFHAGLAAGVRRSDDYLACALAKSTILQAFVWGILVDIIGWYAEFSTLLCVTKSVTRAAVCIQSYVLDLLHLWLMPWDSLELQRHSSHNGVCRLRCRRECPN